MNRIGPVSLTAIQTKQQTGSVPTAYNFIQKGTK